MGPRRAGRGCLGGRLDAVSLKDYYSLLGILASSRQVVHTLDEPAANAAKTQGKDRVLGSILGPQLGTSLTRIDYVPSLGDWKTAWDHVRFDGFLGTRMTMQFTWEGCDSTLAAPLVLDLARLTGRAAAAGETGPLAALGFFFKSPLGSQEHRLAQQWETLLAWSRECADRVSP